MITGSVAGQSSIVVLLAAVFLACAVEMVEALTIVLAVGFTRGWRSALEGTVAAVLVLGALVAAIGPPIIHYVPLTTLRLVVGALLLIFGLQWLRKAVLRAAGLKDKHDEDEIYRQQVLQLSVGGGGGGGDGDDSGGGVDSGGGAAGEADGLRPARSRRSRDPVAFTVAFKGVFLEGLEVVVVVLTLGSTSHRLGLAALAAAAAFVVVGAVGIVVSRQLSSVPENAMKMGVGLMLVSFGTFWTGEGLHVRWPGSDLAIPALAVTYGLGAWILMMAERRGGERPVRAATAEASGSDAIGTSSASPPAIGPPAIGRWVRAFGSFWWEFLIGETPEFFVGALVLLGAVAGLTTDHSLNALAYALLPVAVLVLLGLSIHRASTSARATPLPTTNSVSLGAEGLEPSS